MSLSTIARSLLSCILVYAILASTIQSNFAPLSWGQSSFCIWLLFALSKGWTAMQRSDRYHLCWGWLSVAAFISFVGVYDTSFKSWGDVYLFCGNNMRYCNCDMRWNLRGWVKAAVLWNFVLSSSLAVQKLFIQAGLNGLLPGEEVVTKESFISICWRLIPYWLNNWEQQWGAECSSMMFELPHFAIELLVVLPCVQILCSRLRILALPARQPFRPNVLHLPASVRDDPRQMAMLAPCVIQGVWRPIPNQHQLLPRLRANLRMLVMILAVMGLASFNAMYVPLRLEGQIFKHERAGPMLAAAQICGATADCWSAMDLGAASQAFAANYTATCPEARPLARTLRKHGAELLKMRGSAHTELIPLVETALAIMRLSCERFFVLVSVFAAYLAFCAHVAPWFRMLIYINHRLSKMFQQVILYTFPAVCWVYGAGVIFSTFVSLVFWGAPAKRLYDHLRKLAAVVQPIGLQDATAAQIERMNGNCAVCWSEMTVLLTQPERADQPGQGQPGKALPCGHAFHESCIQRWLKQCHGQGRQPTCPLCNRAISLQVRYRLPLPRRLPRDPLDEPADVDELGLDAEAGRDLQEFFHQRRQLGRQEVAAPRWVPGTARVEARAGPLQAQQPAQATPPVSQAAAQGRRTVRRVSKPHAGSGAEAQQRLQLDLGSASGSLDGEEGPSSSAGVLQPGEVTSRSAPIWREGPPMPVQLTRGAEGFEPRPYLRFRPRGPQQRENQDSSQLGASSGQVHSEHAPSGWHSIRDASRHSGMEAPSPQRQYSGLFPPGEPQASCSTAQEPWHADPACCSSGSSGSSTAHMPDAGRLDDLSAAVRRDRQRAQAYLDFCRAQEAQFKAKVELGTGVMMEAWRTARELLGNAEQLDAMLQTRQGGSGEAQPRAGSEGSCNPGAPPETIAESFAELWKRQQLLWERSQQLHKEAAANFMQP